jgi:hypothetical protein
LGVYNAAAGVSSVDGDLYNSVTFEKLPSPSSSDGYDGRKLTARIYKASQAISAASQQQITFTSADATTNDAGMVGANTITVPSAGEYTIGFKAQTQTASTSEYIILWYNVNGGSVVMLNQQISGTATSATPNGTDRIPLNAGDVLRFYVQTGIATTVYIPTIYVSKTLAPTTISATAETSARYSTGVGQSITNGSNVIVDFGTKNVDPFGLVTTGASWKFTAQEACRVSAKAFIRFANGLSWTSGQYVAISIYKTVAGSPSVYSTGDATINVTGSYATGPSCSVDDVVELNAGDSIDFRASHGESSARSLVAAGSLVYCSIVKIK